MMLRAIVSWSAAAMLAASSTVPLWAQETPAESPPYDMTTYQFVLLHGGPDDRPLGEREIQRLQEQHLAYMSRLMAEDRAILFGPVDGRGPVRGAVVLDVESTEAAGDVMREDPWVRAGRLVFEVHPWWTAKGRIRKPANMLHQTTCYLGLLERPAGAPDYPEDRLREIQQGHLANIREMAASGDLVLAGPMADDGKLRGIFVFRTTDPDRIRQLVAKDPAVKAGRLGVTLYPWNVPRGSLPEP